MLGEQLCALLGQLMACGGPTSHQSLERKDKLLSAQRPERQPQHQLCPL